MVAAEHGHKDVTQLLLTHQAKVNAVDRVTNLCVYACDSTLILGGMHVQLLLDLQLSLSDWRHPVELK